MAQLWSFEEDHIVGTFAYEHIMDLAEDDRLDELIQRLAERGYVSRNRNAIQRRIYDYQRSFFGSEIEYISVQVRKLARVIAEKERNYEWSLKLDSIIAELPKAEEKEFSDFGINNPVNLINLEPLETLGPTLKEVFYGFVKQKGMSIPDICGRSQVNKSTISRIKKHPQKSISKPTAICLCFGLELTLSEAQQLVESAGFKLASNPVDLLVAAYFNDRNYNIFDANYQLYERGLPILFGHTKEREIDY